MSHPFSDKNVLPENIATHRIKVLSKSISSDSLKQIESDLPIEFIYNSDTQELSFSYDGSKVSFTEIINQLEQHDIRPLKNWWFRIKAAFSDFADENVADQAHAKPKGCCNKLPHN